MIILLNLILNILLTETRPTEFLSFADWGGSSNSPYTTKTQLAVAEGMAEILHQSDSQMILGLGDNFYNDGIKNIHDPRFNYTFQNVYTLDKFRYQKFYMIAGNHDHHGNVTAQIAYTDVDPTHRWKYLDNFYYFVQDRIAFVMIDTVILAGAWDNYEPQPIPSVHHMKDKQLEWIERTLEKLYNDPEIIWIFVAGHYPVYSVAEHGSTNYLIRNLLPLLQRYGVTM